MKKIHLFGALVLVCAILGSCKPKNPMSFLGEQDKFNAFLDKTSDEERELLIDRVNAYEKRSFFSSEIYRNLQLKSIDSTRGVDYCSLYIKQYPENLRDDIIKSVHFTAAELKGYLAIADSLSQIVRMGPPGLRIYMAKYPATGQANRSLNNRETVILRATSGGTDISHRKEKADMGWYVAWNYGDPCPPRCKPEQGVNECCYGGNYTITGEYRGPCRTCEFIEENDKN